MIARFLAATVLLALPAAALALSPADDRMLEDVSHRAFRYFWEQTDPGTGLVRDRAFADGARRSGPKARVGSIAATGFGLTALAIATQRGWIGRDVARERARTTLRFFAERAPREHGWFYHFMDVSTGERAWQSEISSVDTSLLLGGVLSVRQYFADDPAIVRLSKSIYERIDFAWMLAGDPSLLCHGWTPEHGFLPSRWDSYCELSLLYALAIGSPAHPISARSWYAWKRPVTRYAGYTYVSGGPLFVHQYSQVWLELKGLRERLPPHTDYFENSVAATRAHRQFCIDLAAALPSYSADEWGVSASDSANGYVAWGGPPRDPAIDGTLVPCAVLGSLMFTPDICLPALRKMLARHGDRAFRRYGFVDAFNPLSGWIDTDVIGIDLGVTLLSAENLRTGDVWRWFMRNPEPRRALRRIGLE